MSEWPFIIIIIIINPEPGHWIVPGQFRTGSLLILLTIITRTTTQALIRMTEKGQHPGII